MQGDLEAAEAELDETLVLQVRVRGEQHPDTVQSLTTMAHIRNAQGKFDQTLDLADRAIAAGSRSLGPEHTAELQAGMENVFALSGLGLKEEAQALAEKVADAYTSTLGEEHPVTLDARRHLF